MELRIPYDPAKVAQCRRDDGSVDLAKLESMSRGGDGNPVEDIPGGNTDRPEADYLRDGIHELRAKHEGVNYRILYFFCGGRAVLSHGITKEDIVPAREIETALRGKALFEGDPATHTYRE